jgi:hypothetical protein
VLHLMWDQTTCNLFANLRHQSKVVRGEVLIAFLFATSKHPIAWLPSFIGINNTFLIT